MNQFFEGLANQNNATVTSVVTQENSSLNAGGYITITKGLMSIDITYWGSVYKSIYPGFASVDDVDWDTLETRIGGVKIDSLSKFNEGLGNMGLTSVSNNLKISDEEIRDEIYKAMGESKAFDNVFKGLKLFDSAPFEERKEAVLEYSILNYEKCSVYTLSKYGFSESNSDKPSLEELLKFKNK
jgi:hypothetical protein